MVDVVAVSWPSEPERRRRAIDDGLPSMLLVEPGTEPPEDMGDLEDWIRVELDLVGQSEPDKPRAPAPAPAPPVSAAKP